jgi:hypothetical protein
VAANPALVIRPVRGVAVQREEMAKNGFWHSRNSYSYVKLPRLRTNTKVFDKEI